jgi:hypothetical protein
VILLESSSNLSNLDNWDARTCPTTAKIKKANRIPGKFLTIRSPLSLVNTMDVLELKREIETLSYRLGKTQDYL